eukprot:scaffold27183_cov66-Phaeocystis_antarctica.AAC.2
MLLLRHLLAERVQPRAQHAPAATAATGHHSGGGLGGLAAVEPGVVPQQGQRATQVRADDLARQIGADHLGKHSGAGHRRRAQARRDERHEAGACAQLEHALAPQVSALELTREQLGGVPHAPAPGRLTRDAGAADCQRPLGAPHHLAAAAAAADGVPVLAAVLVAGGGAAQEGQHLERVVLRRAHQVGKHVAPPRLRLLTC